MPQLWTETYVSQYFWLMVILFSFNYFFTNYVVPSIAKNLKARKKTGIIKEDIKELENNNITVTLPEISIKGNESVVIYSTFRNKWIK